jgi:hypothetical protein
MTRATSPSLLRKRPRTTATRSLAVPSEWRLVGFRSHPLGFLAMFDGPRRAIRCAMAIRDAVQALGIEVRDGLHTGECEVRGDDIGGIGVQIGARVSALARPNEVLVSSTLCDLVIGSGPRVRGARLLRAQGCARRMAFVRRRCCAPTILKSRMRYSPSRSVRRVDRRLSEVGVVVASRVGVVRVLRGG